MRIGLFGVAGFNRGDDAIAEAMVEGLTARLPSAEIRVATIGGPRRTSFDRTKYVLVGRKSVSRICNLIYSILSSDVIVLGGGSLIQDKFGGSRIKGVLGYAWAVTLFAKIFGKPICSAPLGIDALSTTDGERAAREVLGRIDFLCVRDALSADNAKSLGRQCDQICPDPVFSLGRLSPSTIEERYFCFAPAFEGVLNKVAFEVYREIAYQLISTEPMAIIKLVAMDHRPEEDGGVCVEFLESLDSETRSHFEMVVPDTYSDALEVLSNSSGVFAMRLHAIIFAYGSAPVFCLSRTTKTEALIREYFVDGDLMNDQCDVKRIASSAVKSIRGGGGIGGHRENISLLNSRIQGYFDELARYIERVVTAS
jgi:polysaccharide pyruvyl transferase WcaK-like protein